MDGNLAEPSKVPFGEDLGQRHGAAVKDGPPAQKGNDDMTTTSERRSGPELYLDVLFPQVEPQRERHVAAQICQRLWEAREQARAEESARRRVVTLTVNAGHGLGPATAIACLGCHWVAWSADAQHPVRCLADDEVQAPDLCQGAGSMRIDFGFRTTKARGWAAYHAVLFPPCLVRAFGRWKRMTTGVRVAERLWAQREAIRRTEEQAAAAAAAGRHVGVVLDAVPKVAHAACLTCTWLDPAGVSMTRGNWRSLAALTARAHERGD